jgi:hypothetical protein
MGGVHIRPMVYTGNARTHAHAHTYTRIHTRIRTHTRTHIHAHTHTRTHIHARTQPLKTVFSLFKILAFF